MKKLQAVYEMLEYTFDSCLHSIPSILLLIMTTAAAITLSFYLQIIVHESGHLLFGKLTGYRFLSFRIWNKVLVREGHRWRMKTYSDRESIGQCLMLPPHITNRKTPYALNNLGGILLNGITGVFFLCLSFANIAFTYTAWLFTFTFGLFGIIMLIANGLPIKYFGNNDGANYLALRKNKSARYFYIKQLEQLPDLQKGKTYGDLSLEFNREIHAKDLSNPIIGWQRMLEYYSYLDQGLWEKARECLSAFQPVESLDKGMQYTIQLEELFLGIVMRENSAEIEMRYQKMKGFLKKNHKDIDTIRIHLAYKIYRDSQVLTYDERIKKQEGYRKEIKRRGRNYLYPGKAEFCMKMLRIIFDQYFCYTVAG
ncbi:MAG: hypothetical protein E7255_10280 [Lachnospiraceae bacterium]|nr:hypothetical protein [Lachnospiraceae bacterium]